MNKLVHWAEEWFVTGPYSSLHWVYARSKKWQPLPVPEYIYMLMAAPRGRSDQVPLYTVTRCLHLGHKCQFHLSSRWEKNGRLRIKFQMKDYHRCSTAREVSYFLMNLIPLLYRDLVTKSGMVSIASRKNTEGDSHLLFIPHRSLNYQFWCFPYILAYCSRC